MRSLAKSSLPGKADSPRFDLTPVLDDTGRLKPEYTVISDAFGLGALAVQWGSLLLLLAALPLTWSLGGPLLPLALLPFLGLAAYRLTILMHDCAHNTLFSSRKVNNLLGRLTGWMIGSDFEEFRRLHWQHHRRFGKKDDPQGRDYLRLTEASKAQIAWHLARPLLGFNLFKIGGFVPKLSPDASATSPSRRLGFLTGVAATQVAIAALATGLGSLPLLVFFYPLAAATFGLFFSQIRGFCEHVPPGGSTDEEHVRTHAPNWLDRVFFYAINFNYHVEHHLFPSVPSCKLPDLHRELRPQLLGSPSLSPTILGTICTRLRECTR